MKKIITNIIFTILMILIIIISLVLINKGLRDSEKETAKMGIDWKSNTCYLYWE